VASLLTSISDKGETKGLQPKAATLWATLKATELSSSRMMMVGAIRLECAENATGQLY
jgi:hypothetical protein